MKFFIDTANMKEIADAAAMGILDGVTTNPSLMAKEGMVNNKETVQKICDTVGGPVSVEVNSTDFDSMIKEGKEYASWHKHVVVKLPTTRDGVKGCKTLSDQGIRVNMTLCFSANQALIIAKAGAAYCSPFVGRVDDISWDGMQVIKDIRLIYNNYKFKTEILAASLRHPMHVLEAAKSGADVATLPFKVLESLFNHPLTDKGLATFLADFAKVKK